MSAVTMFNSSGSIPKHIAFIMDGNGRWAQQLGLRRVEGHKQGLEALQRTVQASLDYGISYMTVYVFSTENWNRPKIEINALMSLLARSLKKNTDLLDRQGVQIQTIGNIAAMPLRVQVQLKKSIEQTAHNTAMRLTLALNYGSREEVIYAVRHLAKDAIKNPHILGSLDWRQFHQYLYTKTTPDPDLLVRTSGENRISNFLLLQCAYSEFYFTSVHWPDFNKKHLAEAILVYQKRTRRFGRTSDQVAKE